MAVISGWWPSINGDRKYYIEQQAAVNAQIYSNGVLPVGSQLQVLTVAGLTVKVTAGFAWINGYWIYNDADYTLTADAPDGVLGRVDRVILKWSRESRETTIEIKKGAAASAPIGMELQRDADAYELCLAEITIGAGITAIAQSHIYDTRPVSTLCGFSAVYDPPVADEWFAQFNAAFTEWFDSVRSMLDGDVAGNLANQIEGLRTHTDGVLCEIYNGEATIPASSWVNNMETARYEATVTNEYVRTDTDVDVWVSDAQSGKYTLGWLMPQDGGFTLYTTGTAPTEDIVLYISVMEVREI